MYARTQKNGGNIGIQTLNNIIIIFLFILEQTFFKLIYVHTYYIIILLYYIAYELSYNHFYI